MCDLCDPPETSTEEYYREELVAVENKLREQTSLLEEIIEVVREALKKNEYTDSGFDLPDWYTKGVRLLLDRAERSLQ